jgi:hypothetical protein
MNPMCSFHGAVKDRAYNPAEVERLAKYLMITTEKWYVPHAFSHFLLLPSHH